jgi:hypothetical protein
VIGGRSALGAFLEALSQPVIIMESLFAERKAAALAANFAGSARADKNLSLYAVWNLNAFGRIKWRSH